MYSSDIKIISKIASLHKNFQTFGTTQLISWISHAQAAESQKSSSNTQLGKAVSEPVELRGNNSGTGPEEPVSRYPCRTHNPPD